MTSHPNTTGQIARSTGRAPNRRETGRVCAEGDCFTRLSTYNRLETCFRHSRTRYPRTRGRKPKA